MARPAASAVTAAMAAPAMPRSATSTSRIVAIMLMTLIAICTDSASAARACPISQPSTIACSSLVSPAPSDCAVKATVLMRRKANSQNRQSKITEAIATPPSSVASPSRPIAVVETMPISGVVRFAIIAGPAMAKTCLVVTSEEEFTGLLQFDDHAVHCSRVGQLVHPAQHVIAHVCEDQLLGIDLAEMRFQRL